MNDHLRFFLTPALRAYIRHGPLPGLKRTLWNQFISPNIAWYPHEFLASTVFGSKIAGNTSDFIQQFIYYFGIWEPNLTRWVRGRLSPGDTFIDVGANIGYFSLLASTLVGDAGRVVAIEASPATFEALRRNLDLNMAHNVRAVNIAASDCAGSVRLFRGDENNIGLTTMFEGYGHDVDAEVPSAPLGAILEPHEWRKARLIKIDVEGAEWSVVSGMLPLLRDCRPELEIAIEIHYDILAAQGKCPEDVLQLFYRQGFHAYTIANDYSANSHIAAQDDERPVRLNANIDSDIDLVLSKIDADRL